MTKPLALSTMYAQQSRFDDGADFVRFAAEAGYDAIEISHSTRPDKLQRIIDHPLIPIPSVHQPAPWAAHHDGRGNSHLNLASIDDDERNVAIQHATESIRWAARIGVDRLVVHLGQVGDGYEMFLEEFQMRRLYDSGQAEDARFPELREAAIRKRDDLREPYVAAARETLLELVRAAEPHGIAIGLENRYHFHEIPHVDEYEELLDGLVPEQAGYWHDTGHAEVLHRLGFVDKRAWLDAHGRRTIGAHLHDVSGIGDHRSPGDGDVDWSYIVEGVAHLPRYTLEINQHQPDDRVRNAIPFLASLGLH
ncbi:MAG TPA: TIM barrel protein [Tepidiformaceae bacterium]|nr:TIM barrel protein [Tepidiformaceae bacterium]